MNRNSQNKLTVFWPFALAIAILLGIQLGMFINKSSGGKQSITNSSKSSYDKLYEVLGLVKENYVDTLDNTKLTDDLIRNYLADLDPHSVYIPASEIEAANEELQGNFEGIGIEFFISNDTILVVNALSGGPSEKLGMMAGDKIIYIDDSLVAGNGVTNAMVMKKLRGEKDSKVKVTVKRNSQKELIPFNIIRDKIPMNSLDVAYMLDAETGYIKVSNFSRTTGDEFRAAIKDLKAKNMKRLVLDLRQNPGGYLQMAVEMAEIFLEPRQLVVYTQGAKSPKVEYYTEKASQSFLTEPLCVLIDEGSASASEIVSGAMQDHDRATIIGRRSFGKGLVQSPFNMKDGSELRLTIARYYTPAGRCIQKSYKNGLLDYDTELLNRYEHGELFSQDSIHQNDTVKYYTDKGKVVYGGGGITPDVYVPIDTTFNWTAFNSLRTVLPEFIYNYYAQHKDDFEPYNLESFLTNYQISESLLNEFYAYASKSLKNVDSARQNAAVNKKIKLYLKAYIGRQKFYNAGFYPVINQDDDVIRKAMQQFAVSK